MFSSLKTIAKRKFLERQLKDADSETRRSAIEALGELGEPADADLIARALKDEDVTVRMAAAKAMSGLGEHNAVDPLVECITERRFPDGEWQTEILVALESLKDPRSVEACTQALTHTSVKVRCAAASALGNLGDPSVIPALMASLRDKEYTVVRQSGRALTKLGRSAVGPLIQMLEYESGQGQNAAAEALGVIGDPQAIEPLIAALKSEDSFLQIAAAKALSNFDDPRVASPLVHALEESSTAAFFYGVREEAEAALIKMGRRAIEAFLLALRDPNAGGKVIIAKLLGQIHEPRNFDALVETLGDPSLELRKAALQSLMTLDQQRAQPVVQSMLSDPDYRVRHAAAELLVSSGVVPASRLEHAQLAIGLGKFRDALRHGDDAIRLILVCAQDDDAGVRREVFEALGHSGDARFVETLNSALTMESDPGVQRAIFNALEGLGAVAA